MSNKLFLNSLSGTVLYAVNIVVAFIMSPIVIKVLGNRDYGLWELVISVIGYMGLLDLGIGPALVRFVSVADGKQDKDDLQKTISTSFVFFVAVGVVAVLAFVVLGYYPAIVAGKEAQDVANLGAVFILVGLNAGMTFPLQVFIATLMGVQRHYFINNVRIVLLIAKAMLSYYLLAAYQSKGLLILALVEPVFTTIQVVAFVGAVYLDNKIPNMALTAVSWAKAKEMMAFGAKSATMLVASRLQNQSVPLIIGNVLGLSQIVYFVMPNRLIDYAKGLAQAIGAPLTPYFGNAFGKGDRNVVVRSWLMTSYGLQIIMLGICVLVMFYGRDFLVLWIGSEYGDKSGPILNVLLAGLIVDCVTTNSFRMLNIKGCHGKCSLIWLTLSVAIVPIAIALVHLYGLFFMTVGITTISIIGNIITLSLACKLMETPIIYYIKQTLQKLIIPILGMIIVGLCANGLIMNKSYKIIATKSIVLAIVYFGLVFIIMDKSLKKNLINKLKGKMVDYNV